MKIPSVTMTCLLLVLIVACSDIKSGKVVTSAELMSRISDNSAPIILDVRSEQEFRRGHVPGAINIPFGDHQPLLSSLNLAKTSEVVVYCEGGGRAEKMGDHMQQQGFSEVRHLQGNMNEWRKDALPAESGVTTVESLRE